MEINVIARSGYEKIYWGERYLAGITAEVSERGFGLTVWTDQDLSSLPGKNAIVLSSSRRWIRSITSGAVFRPVLLTPEHADGMSFVTFNYAGGIRTLISKFRENGFTKTALVSCNGDSLNDLAKRDAFVSAIGAEDQVYYHRNSIGFGIFDEFLHDVKRYDSVVCTNDIVYLMLKRRLAAAGIDCGGIGFATFSDRRFDLGGEVMSAVTDYYGLGRAAVGCLALLDVTPGAELRMTIDCGFAGQGHSSARETENEKTEYLEDGALYVQQIKYLLGGADKTDIEILRRSLDGESYEEICERMYMSLNTLKRRMKSMLDISGCKSKNEMIAFLKQYL